VRLGKEIHSLLDTKFSIAWEQAKRINISVARWLEGLTIRGKGMSAVPFSKILYLIKRAARAPKRVREGVRHTLAPFRPIRFNKSPHQWAEAKGRKRSHKRFLTLSSH